MSESLVVYVRGDSAKDSEYELTEVGLNIFLTDNFVRHPPKGGIIMERKIMKPKILSGILLVSILLLLTGCEDDVMVSEIRNVNAWDLYNGKSTSISEQTRFHQGLQLLRIGGKVRYFGMNISVFPPASYDFAGVSDVHVWLAEYPRSKMLNIRTDEQGYWKMYILKPRGKKLNVSFMYQKDHFTDDVEHAVFPGGLPDDWNMSLIKSNVYIVGNDDIDDVAMQMPDELYLYAAKTNVEQTILATTGLTSTIENMAVATVGKSWASIFNPTLPHGDKGATVVIEPAVASPLNGPIYFDETVSPNPGIGVTSVDGGVLFTNLATGVCSITAKKDPYIYDTIQFNVDSSAKLYVASPPHSIQGTNTSGAGEQ